MNTPTLAAGENPAADAAAAAHVKALLATGMAYEFSPDTVATRAFLDGFAAGAANLAAAEVRVKELQADNARYFDDFRAQQKKLTEHDRELAHTASALKLNKQLRERAERISAELAGALRDARASFLGLQPDFCGPVAAQMGKAIERINAALARHAAGELAKHPDTGCAAISFADLRAAGVARGAEWTGYVMSDADKLEDLLFRTNELAGESGEAAEAIGLLALSALLASKTGGACNRTKKLARHNAGMVGGVPLEESLHAIADELADVVICCDRVAEALAVDLGAAVRTKFNRTSEKYGLSVKIVSPEEGGANG